MNRARLIELLDELDPDWQERWPDEPYEAARFFGLLKLGPVIYSGPFEPTERAIEWEEGEDE